MAISDIQQQFIVYNDMRIDMTFEYSDDHLERLKPDYAGAMLYSASHKGICMNNTHTFLNDGEIGEVVWLDHTFTNLRQSALWY